MIERTFVTLGRQLFRLRYRMKVIGLDALEKERPDRGILFLPNHPALIDPLLLSAILYDRFCPRPLADEKQMDRPWLKRMLHRIRPITLPNVMAEGRAGRAGAAAAISEVANTLAAGENVLLYPAGGMMREKRERLGAKSAVADILAKVPEAQIVLVRITGLWGSSFSWARGAAPEPERHLRRYIASVLAGGIFFVPKREVTIEFHAPEDFPRSAGKQAINRYLEAFYAAAERPALHVPYYLGRKAEPLPDPDLDDKRTRDVAAVPDQTRKLVDDKLKEMTGVGSVSPTDRLGVDLGLDSLSTVALMTWIEREFGVPQEDVSGLLTVADCYLAAAGNLGQEITAPLNPIADGWFADTGRDPVAPPEGEKLTDLFLAAARAHPTRVVIGDQLRGEKTYRDVVLAALVLGRVFRTYPERCVGLMLPASGTAAIVYLALLFAGKVPVMVNWTAGERQLRHSLGAVGVERVLTAEALLTRLARLGLDYSGVGAELLPLERLGQEVGRLTKLQGAVRSRLSWRALRNAEVDDTAVILFTSGSESLPKAVPLTHGNLLANMRDYLSLMALREDERVLGILPPFHSFGLAGTIVMPLCNGLRTVYHANPTEGAQIARIVEAYRATFALLTPTFLSNIIDAAPEGALASLRTVITGAEKCPESLFERFRAACPDGRLIEGYGITECAPVVSANDPDHPVPGTIGKLMPSMSRAIVHPETGERIEGPGRSGRLLLRGPNVFGGYLGRDTKSPFVELDGGQWYDTGDIVSEDENGVLTFKGRLKRFVKLGGEMISLPAIEAVLAQAFPGERGELTLAVGAAEGDPPEVVLFTVSPTTREEANKAIAAAGLSPLHSVRRIVRVEAIPTLGTGKTDYRSLEALVNKAPE